MNSKKIKNWDRTQTWIPEKIYEPKKFEALISDYEGRPHWGKRFSGTHEKIRKLYPAYDDFNQLRRSCDPNGLFRNRFVDRVFPDFSE